MSVLSGRKFFTVWFGLFLPPILIGAAVISFATSLWLGLGTVVLLLAWIYETFRTTCCRCWAFGTPGCGLPGLLAPRFASRKPAASLSRRRIRVHLMFDWGVALYLNGIYCLYPPLLPVVLLWSVGAWWVSIGPKRYHGLLDRLRRAESGLDRARVSLPVLAARDEGSCSGGPCG